MDDMSSQMETMSPSTGAITVSAHQLTPGVMYDYDWNFARAFLYSLTVLTTIGEFFIFLLCLICSIINSRIFSRFPLKQAEMAPKLDTRL